MVDGKPLTEPYIYQNSPLGAGPGGRQFGKVTVPQGRLWVMGDHRSESADSRSHRDDKYSGTIAVGDVIGKGAVVVWPLNRLHILHAPDIQSASAATAPSVFGLAGAVPLTWWHRRRRLRREGGPQVDGSRAGRPRQRRRRSARPPAG
jgi:signal peptidase I